MMKQFTEIIAILLQGNLPQEIDTSKIADKQALDLANMLNQLIKFMQEVHNFIIPLSKGELADIKISPKNFFGSPFKELHSRLMHLTWQANQVANGDYSQRVDFMGNFSEAFNNMIVSLDSNEKLLKKKINELEEALLHIGKLEGILPICSFCKKVRIEGTDFDDQANWLQIERYISERTEAQFSHSLCPDCLKKHYQDDLLD